ncbi:MAG: 3-oxoacyl-ACP synthase [Maribacter sp.]|nr:MAG: 3-oxoacyl-ACP synthase [Maribacter sp.]
MTTNDNFKQTLFLFCQTFVEDRIARIQKGISSIQEAMFSETKSSAGDKHETGRAMLQLEREKLGQQLSEIEKVRQILYKVPTENKAAIIGLGSLVKTSQAYYYLAISAGEFKGKKPSVFCISSATPIGRLLVGKSVADVVVFNGQEIKILEIE